MKLTDSEENTYKAVRNLLREAKVKVTDTTLIKMLRHHPEFPRLTAVSDVLDELRVANLSTQLSIDQLKSVPLPTMVFLNVDEGIMAPVTKICEGDVHWLHTKYGYQVERIENFVRNWSGITLIMETTELSGERNYFRNNILEIWTRVRLPFMAGLLGIALFLVYLRNGQVFHQPQFPIFQLLLALKLIGTVTCLMLVWYSIDSANTFLRKVCQLNGTTNCSNLLSSQAAKLFGVINWSEIGLIYFAGSLLTIVISAFEGTSLGTLQAIKLLNLAALPYTAYSISYQAFRAKTWCVLCLTIQFILWSEFVVMLPIAVVWPTGNDLILIAIGFTVSLFIWLLVQPGMHALIKIKPLEMSHQKLKFDSDYISTLLNKQRYLPPIFTGMKVGRLGNPQATNTLIMVTNPTCEACARIHGEIESTIKYQQELQCIFILAGSNIEGEISGEVTRTILALSESEISSGIHSWFGQKHMGVNKWKHLIKQNQQLGTDGSEQMEMHLRWLELAGVTSTPTLFLNGVSIPRMYAISEIAKLTRQLQLSRI